MLGDEDRQFGRVMPTPRRDGWRIDIRPHGEIYGLAGVGFREREHAEWVLGLIRVEIARGKDPADVCALYLRNKAPINLVHTRYSRWLEIKHQEVEAGNLSPRTVQEYERYARPGGELDWWKGLTIHEAHYGALEDWALWMGHRGLAPATRKNVLGAFRTFLGWLHRRSSIPAVPEFPTMRVPEHEPVILSPRAQDSVLQAIPWPERGAALVASLMGLRPGEVRALSPADYAPADGDRPPLLRVDKAMQTLSWDGVPGPTKNRRTRVLPVPEPVVEWIEDRWLAAARLEAAPGAPLFVNPRTGKRWSHWALRQCWLRGCKAAGVQAPLYEGTKHSGATAMMARSANPRAVQEILGHADARSTERYAKLTDQAKIEVLRGRPPSSG